jgi:hypothetical protein
LPAPILPATAICFGFLVFAIIVEFYPVYAAVIHPRQSKI